MCCLTPRTSGRFTRVASGAVRLHALVRRVTYLFHSIKKLNRSPAIDGDIS